MFFREGTCQACTKLLVFIPNIMRGREGKGREGEGGREGGNFLFLSLSHQMLKEFIVFLLAKGSTSLSKLSFVLTENS